MFLYSLVYRRVCCHVHVKFGWSGLVVMGSQVAQADSEGHYAAEDGLELMTRGL